jgi:Tol biopolymer transport system component
MKHAAIVLVIIATTALCAETPAIFQPGVISTAPLAESGGTFSPDEREFYFTVRNPTTTSRPLSVVCVSRRAGTRWTKPEVASFSGMDWDTGPAMSPDGKRMFFASIRNGREDTDLWYVDREGDRWSEPHNAGEIVNSTFEDQTPSVAADGTLYFASNRAGGKG